MPDETASTTDNTLRWIREIVAAGIAVIVVLATFFIVAWALRYTGDPERFARVKDLILVIFPVLTLVLGYYFTRSSTESRAENAEAISKAATSNAQTATEGQNAALAEAAAAKSKENEAIEAMKELGEAAEKAITPTLTRGLGVLGGEEAAEPPQDPTIEFRVAWARAKRLLK
ncbi:MAG: hypothetical protein V1792_21765 [Pseudomonadota bacterium]